MAWWWSLLVTGALWFILGVTLPLCLLAFPRYDITPLTAIAILLGTSLFATVSVVQGVMSLREKPFDWTSYINQRWYKPILTQLKEQEVIFTNGGLVDTNLFYEALNSGERNRFDANVVAGLDSYLKAAVRYNDIILQFSAAAVAALKADPLLGPMAANYESPKGGPVMHPYDLIADDERFKQQMSGWEKMVPASDYDVSVETLGPNWSRVELKIPGAKLYQDPAQATSAFERVRSNVRQLELANQLLDARKSVGDSSRHLNELMEAKLRE